jgi:D-glycero-alpha-D-manno-heptose 1-phosphate guanylyltransferase
VPEAVILAGGLGTRLRSVAGNLPKPMVQVHNRPFLEFILDLLTKHEISRVLLSVGYGADAIVRHFGMRYGDLIIDYVREHEPLGTGGALARAFQHIDGPAAFALNGDTYFDLNYGELRAAFRGSLSVGLAEVHDAFDRGYVVMEQGRIVRFEAAGKHGPALVNGGVYYIAKDLFRRYPMPAIFSFEKQFLERFTAELAPTAYIGSGAFLDIGVPERYALAASMLPVHRQ